MMFITNALMRCTRSDNAASSVFELVRDDLGLWVLELDYGFSKSWEAQMESILSHIEGHRALLKSIGSCESNLTFHLSVQSNAMHPVRIPVRLSKLASECGFEIELCLQSDHEE